MSGRVACVAGALFSIAALGCGLYGDRIRQFQMAPRLAYDGFSFDRPTDPRWFILLSEQDYTDVTLRSDMASDTHTVFMSISYGWIEREPTSHEDFVALAGYVGQKAPYPVTERSVGNKAVTIQNQWCVRIDSRSTAHTPAQDLEMIILGYRCLHPIRPKTTLDFFYSERGLESELDPALQAEGEAFLRGVRIDVGPGQPAS